MRGVIVERWTVGLRGNHRFGISIGRVEIGFWAWGLLPSAFDVLAGL
jgi:hypothetical protein